MCFSAAFETLSEAYLHVVLDRFLSHGSPRVTLSASCPNVLLHTGSRERHFTRLESVSAGLRGT